MTDVMRDDPPMPTMQAMRDMKRTRTMAEEFHSFLSSLPGNPEMTLAKRQLEMAVMWAVKGIAIEDEKL